MTEDWKDKLNGHCECFAGGHNQFGLTSNPCDYSKTCDAINLRNMLLDTKAPTLVQFISCLLEMKMFTRKEIILAVQDMFKNSFDAAEVAYTKTIHKLKQENYHISRGDNGIMHAKKEITCQN
jgi:hypothetical protein